MKFRIVPTLFLCLLLGACAETTTTPADSVSDQQMEKTILSEVNAFRSEQHLQPLHTNPVIAAAAKRHSYDMATHRVEFGHGGYNSRIDGLFAQFKPSYGGAENVAYNSRSLRNVVELWLHSPGHRKNIEGNYNLTGIGVEHDDSQGGWYVTQIFLNSSAHGDNQNG